MAQLILDGLSMPETLADEGFIASYMRPFAPDASGGYLAAEWGRVRDMLRWFPWFACQPATRIAMDAPDAAWMADYGIDLFSAGPHYASAYGAAMRYDPAPALARVAVPTLVAARQDDVLHGYLARAAASGNPNVRTQSLPADRAAWLGWLHATLSEAAAPTTPTSPQPTGQRCYVSVPHGLLHVTRSGAADGVPWLVLSAPTTLQAHSWAAALAAHAPVLVPDLPGFGESDPLPGSSTAQAMADALAAMLDALGLAKVHVLGVGLASPLGAVLARRHAGRVATLVLDGLPPHDPAQAATFAQGLCPPVPFDAHAGTHLHRIWHMLRDGEAQWPWHDGTSAATRRLPALLEPLALHAALTGVLKQPARWGDAAMAALAAGAQPATWAPLACPVLAFTHADPAYADAPSLAHACRAQLLPRPDALDAAALLITAQTQQVPA